MTQISAEKAKEVYGITNRHDAMPNGECRFRLVDKSGLGYIRTEASDKGGWQNSHTHGTLSETLIVQAGWVVVARLVDLKSCRLGLMQPGSIWTARPGCAHNVYMSANSILHVVKHGQGSGSDWITNAETNALDSLTKELLPAEILLRATPLHEYSEFDNHSVRQPC